MPTEKQVFLAAEVVLASGARASLRIVMARLVEQGRGGSFRDVGPHVRQWKARRGYRPRLVAERLPDQERTDQDRDLPGRSVPPICATRRGNSRVRIVRLYGVNFLHALISGIVRPQPWHHPVRPSNSQTEMQGSSLRVTIHVRLMTATLLDSLSCRFSKVKVSLGIQ